MSARPQPWEQPAAGERRGWWRRLLRHEDRVLLLTLAAAVPGTATALVLLWRSGLPTSVRAVGSAALLVVAGAFAAAARRRVVHPLRTLASLLEAMRQEDYSMRGRRTGEADALDDVLREVNLLSERLGAQRLSALEASALLRAVMATIDVAIFAFDPDGRLRLVNRAGERLLGRPETRLLGRPAAELGLEAWLEGEPVRTEERAFPSGAGRWGVRRTPFREGGRRHQLLVVADLRPALRAEERKAWQRLIRVLGHELNNSLAPIKSTAATLRTLAAKVPEAADCREDMTRGLDVIEKRAAALSRFMSSYAQLARLPPPSLEPLEIAPVVARVAALETRLPMQVVSGPGVSVEADPAQLEQVLINLIRNAVDAALETGGTVAIGWSVRAGGLEVVVEDEGPGISNPANLFVPFFTTKPEGSGIGLALSRQIAEAHGGSLTLENRPDRPGCVARLRLPLPATVVAAPAPEAVGAPAGPATQAD